MTSEIATARMIPLVIMLIAATGCGGGEGDGDGEGGSAPKLLINDPNSKAFLSPANFNPSSADLSDLSADELADEINEISIFVANDPESDEDDDSSDTDDESQQCMDDLFKDAVVGSGDAITIEMTGDFATCISSSADAEARELFKVDKFDIHIFFEVTCEGVDFSTISGESLDSELFEEHTKKCLDAPSATIHTNSEIETDMEIYLFGKARIKANQKEAQHQENGRPCELKPSGEVLAHTSACIVDALSTSEGEVDITEDEAAADGPKIVGSRVTLPVGFATPESGTYYSNTTLDFVINGWNGTMTYTDAETAPTWTATKGSETASGTLDPDK